jgi:hypothetical protein
MTLQEIYEYANVVQSSDPGHGALTIEEYGDYLDFMEKYPDTLKMTWDHTACFSSKNLETFLSNMQTAQSNLSSLNDQQGTRTNQAMQRSSGMLETLKSMMQAAQQARNSAATTGAV